MTSTIDRKIGKIVRKRKVLQGKRHFRQNRRASGIGDGVGRARNFGADYLDSALRARPMSRPFRVIVISAPAHHPPWDVPARRRYIEIPQSHLTSNAGGLRSCNTAGNSVINSADKRHRHSIRSFSLFLPYVCEESTVAHLPFIRTTRPLSQDDDSVVPVHLASPS